ncbi:laccase TilA [Penicillium chermesinum]|uniref:Laccase TilA n=1 Tax=Penicillium chermesinum TaxID=63820 RepID=A0A9W9TK48_9EURO|nr:laccase TilA [Penicillium chermesinum]KAJ5225786.1 laccase TilA [Penicillium chermesinum]KAJ6161004.1 laccase TilA [Penicillium chermesinum]
MLRLRSLELIAVLCLIQLAWAELVRFHITLTWEDWHEGPGATRKMIFANRQFPAPPLRLNQGDDVEFHVTNLMNKSTTVHFHGIDQTNTPWSDGVPGLSQKPIPPGGQFLYKWNANQYGSYFYHAHTRGQIEDGLYGSIRIQPSVSVEKPFHLITNNTSKRHRIELAELRTSSIILSDWRQLTSEQSWNAEKATGLDSYCVDALLINGKGSIQCLGRATLDKYTTPAQKSLLDGKHLTDTGCMPPIKALEGPFPHNYSAIVPTMFYGCRSHQGLSEVFQVKAADRFVSYDLISAAATNTLMFSIDEHKMYVYAVDGRYIEPIRVDALSLANGNRYSVLVELDKPVGDYTVRLATVGVNQILNATATLTYERNHASTQPPPKKSSSIPSIDITGMNTTANTIVLDDTAIVPFPVETPSGTVAQTHILRVGRYERSFRWTLGNSSYALALENSQPLLFNPNSSLGYSDLTVRTLNDTWVDFIFDVFEPLQPPHPIHKHSNKFYVIGQGQGAWNYSSVAEAMEHIPESFNLKTPQIRDTYATPAASTGPTWLALRYHVVNPGAFLMHCHIQVHLSGGMALAILDGVDKWPVIPKEFRNAGPNA